MIKQVDDDAVLEEFKRRVQNEWLPTFCNDSKRKGKNLFVENFRKDSWKKLTPTDARDCLLAFKNEIVTDQRDGTFTVHHSKATEQLFWEGLKKLTPRPIFLWLEPVISFAAMYRLHKECGWAKECLGMQTKDWKFDIAVRMPDSKQSDAAYILGEVKRTSDQVDTLVDCLHYFRFKRDEDFCSALKTLRNSEDKLKNVNQDKLKNAHRKWLALRKSCPKIFWALGPGRDSRVFEVNDSTDGDVTLKKATSEKLCCPFEA